MIKAILNFIEDSGYRSHHVYTNTEITSLSSTGGGGMNLKSWYVTHQYEEEDDVSFITHAWYR